MREYERESNITIIINALRKVIEIFSGPFLTTYFIKTSSESIMDISIYNIYCYIILAISSVIVGYIIKNKWKMATFRTGVITNFIYILAIVVLRERVIDYLWLLAILYGFSTSLYYLPFNLFITNKIKNENRTRYETKNEIVASIINIVIPVLLGSIITVTNYRLTAFIILFISFVQIALSFFLKPIEETNEKFKLKEVYNKIKNNKNAKRMLIVEYLVGLSVNYSALVTIVTILIYNSFNTDLNLGIITSIAYILQIFVAYLYGKYFKNRKDSNLIIFTAIVPILTLFLFLIFPNNATLVIYNLCYTVFINLLSLIRMIRLYNVSNTDIINQSNQAEFWTMREISINMGRITSYILLLIVGITKNDILLNVVMIILTLFIFILGNVLKKVEKVEEN